MKAIALALALLTGAACRPPVAVVPVLVTVKDGAIVLPPFLADAVPVCIAERTYAHRLLLECTSVGAVRTLARTALLTE